MTFYETSPPPLACQQIGLTHTPGLSQTQQIQGPHQSKPLSPSLNLKSMSISSSTRENQDRGPLSLLSASFGHPLAAYTPLNSPFPGELG